MEADFSMKGAMTDDRRDGEPTGAHSKEQSFNQPLSRTMVNTPSFVTSCFLIKRRIPWSNLESREVISGEPDAILSNNTVQTGKYSAVNFIPKNLFEQFSKTANIYFLIIGIMQMIQAISITNGSPTIFLPLAAIVSITALKDLFEDLKRHRSDMEENRRTTICLKNGVFQECEWQDLRCGDIIKVMQNEYFPCDIFVLNTSEKKLNCFIETKNLDGETNMKFKTANKDIGRMFKEPQDYSTTKLRFNYEKPNPYLYTFSGSMYASTGAKFSCDSQSFVLRGCSLRNTEYVYGLCSYTGHDTKIMLNSVKAKAKSSKLEVLMGKQIKIVFIFQIILCMFASMYHAGYYSNNENSFPYLETKSEETLNNFGTNFFVRLGNWILIFTNFVPISLLVTLEMVKFIQGYFISIDKRMETLQGDVTQPTTVQSSNLNEELGQVQYIFSDKTGTLTCNEMEYKKCCINGVSFGEDRSYGISAKQQKITNVDFLDKHWFNAMKNMGDQHHIMVNKFLLLLVLCHTVIVEEKEGEIIYNASSPDELALLNFAKTCGYSYHGIDENNFMLIQIDGQEHKYKLLHVLEFTSTRLKGNNSGRE